MARPTRGEVLGRLQRYSGVVLSGTIAGLFAISSRIDIGRTTTIDLRDRPRVVWFVTCAVLAAGMWVLTPRHTRLRRRLWAACVGLFLVGWFWNSGRQGLSEAANPLFDAFRANGRFMWVVSYALLIAGFIVIADLAASQSASDGRQSPVTRRPTAMLGAALLVVAVGLQFVDTITLQKWGRAKIVDDSVERAEYMRHLTDTVAVIADQPGVTHMEIHPELGCLTSAQEVEAFRDALIAASINELPLRQDYSSRPLISDCGEPVRSESGSQLVVIGANGLLDVDGTKHWCEPFRLVGICDPTG